MTKKPNLRYEIQFRGIKHIFNEIIAENSLNLRIDKGIQVQETFKTLKRYDLKRTSLCHIIVKNTRTTEPRKNI
jgi:hypothetical protein